MTAHSHDAGYKTLFSHPDMIRDLITGFIPDEWLQSLDYSTLEKISASYVSEDFQQREGDVVWRVKVGEDWAYVYLLVEFQSSIDRYMALRILVYVGLLYQDLIKQKVINSRGQLPPVLPIVLYNGKPRWSAPLDIADLIPDVPGLLEIFKPRMQYLLIDEGRFSDDELASQRNVVAALFRLEQTPTQQAMDQVLADLADWLADRADLRKLVVGWLEAHLLKRGGFDEVADKVADLKEIRIMLSERIEQWKQEFRAEGLREGRQEGRREGRQEGRQEGVLEGIRHNRQMLLQLLTHKFGEPSAPIKEQIDQASLPTLDAWLCRLLDAKTVDEVFGNSDTAH